MTKNSDLKTFTISIPFNLRRLVRSLGSFGILTVFISNVAEFMGNLEQIQNFILRIFGFYNSLVLHGWFRWTILFGLIAGYLSLALWIYARYFLQRTSQHQIGFGGVALLGGLVLCAFNLGLLQAKEQSRGPVLRQAETSLSKAIISQTATSGGLSFWQHGGEDEAQVWTTAQGLYGVLTSYRNLTERQDDTSHIAKNANVLRSALDYIERMRLANSSGGWGYMEGHDSSVNEIAGWVVLAKIASIHPSIAGSLWSEAEVAEMIRTIDRDLALLAERQYDDGGWSPIHKTNVSRHLRTYSTVMVCWAFIAARQSTVTRGVALKYDRFVDRGIRWLLSTHNFHDDGAGGWVPNPAPNRWTEKFIGLTAQTLFILSEAEGEFDFLKNNIDYIAKKKNFITYASKKENSSTYLSGMAISYNQRVHDTDRYLRGLSFTAESSTFLWYPWSLLLANAIRKDNSLNDTEREGARTLLNELLQKSNQLLLFVQREPALYPTAEGLYAITTVLHSLPDARASENVTSKKW